MEDNTIQVTESQADEKKYTEAEFQSAVDRRVSEALKTQKRKIDEANKLANMSLDEKREYEYQERKKELDRREKELAQRELSAEASRQLTEQGLSTDFVKYVLGNDAESTLANIKEIKSLVDAMITGVKTELVKTGSPAAASGSQIGMTKEEFNKLPLNEQAKLPQEMVEAILKQ